MSTAERWWSRHGTAQGRSDWMEDRLFPMNSLLIPESVFTWTFACCWAKGKQQPYAISRRWLGKPSGLSKLCWNVFWILDIQTICPLSFEERCSQHWKGKGVSKMSHFFDLCFPHGSPCVCVQLGIVGMSKIMNSRRAKSHNYKIPVQLTLQN